jgi:hypothetical protein
VTFSNGSLNLSWLGGDPNGWDQVTYELYFGGSADNLIQVTDGLSSCSYTMDGLAEGTTYYWRVVSRDDSDAAAGSAVWQFTTDGPPPEFAVVSVSWVPQPHVIAGDEMTFTATIRNDGAGPAVDPFPVSFQVDGVIIGSMSVSQILHSGESTTVDQTWIAEAGEHTVEVIVDGTASQSASFDVRSNLDTDGDGMADDWEMEYFGSLSRDGTGDLDLDGISDLEEYVGGTDPTQSNAPTAPRILSPEEDGIVTFLQPQLVIRESCGYKGRKLGIGV